MVCKNVGDIFILSIIFDGAIATCYKMLILCVCARVCFVGYLVSFEKPLETSCCNRHGGRTDVLVLSCSESARAGDGL